MGKIIVKKSFKPKEDVKPVSAGGVKRPSNKNRLNRALLARYASRLEILAAVKVCIEKGWMTEKPEIGGPNKLKKEDLVLQIPSFLLAYVYKHVKESREKVSSRKLSGENAKIHESLSGYNCKQLIQAIKSANVEIQNVYTIKKAALVFAIIDSGSAKNVLSALPPKELTPKPDMDITEFTPDPHMVLSSESEDE